MYVYVHQELVASISHDLLPNMFLGGSSLKGYVTCGKTPKTEIQEIPDREADTCFYNMHFLDKHV